MDAHAQLKAALDQPVGGTTAQLEDVVAAFFAMKLGRTVEGGGRSWDLAQDAHVDAMFRHVAGGEWATALVQRKELALSRPGLVALAFRDAPFSAVQAYAAINTIHLSRMLDARLGRDAPEALLELSRAAQQPRAKQAALAAAIAASSEVAPDLEAELFLEAADAAPLLRKALRALGPTRASAVAVRSLDRLGPDREDRAHCLRSVLECFCAELEPAWPAIAARTAELGPSIGWSHLGEYLGQSHEWRPALAFSKLQLEHEPRWAHVVRALLDAWVRAGVPLDPALDPFIDPAGAAASGGDAVRFAHRLLKSLPPDRAEAVLSTATFASPADPLHFIIPGLPAAGLERLARAAVADPAFVAGVNLRPLGPDFGPALARALAEGKPKPALLKSLQRNLDAAVFAELSKALKPSKPPAAKKTQKPSTKKSAPREAGEEMTKRPVHAARPGFEADRSWALVIFGVALPRLTFDQVVSLEAAVKALGAPFIAAPNGDLCSRVDDPLPFPVVVGAVAAQASVRSTQDAHGRPSRVDTRHCRDAEALFSAARPRLDTQLRAAGLSADAPPGLYVVAAGPLASAVLEARDDTATVLRDTGPEEHDPPQRILEMSWDAEPDAVRIDLRGTFALSARYD